MSIKIKIEKHKANFNKVMFEKEYKQLSKLKQSLELLKGTSIYLKVAKGTFGDHITQTRCNIKDTFGTTDMTVVATNNKEYIVFNESECEETGATTYSKPIRKTFSYTDTIHNITSSMEAIKRAKAEVIKEIKKFREKRKQVPFENKEIKIDVANIRSKYTVYKSGVNGATGTVTYKDVWRGTEHTYELSGNTNLFNMHMVPGEIMRLSEERKLKKIFENKSPKTTEHHVAVELEFISKSDKLSIAKRLLENNVENFVTLKDDGSLRSEDEYQYTHELVVCVPQSKYKEVLRKIVNVLDESGCKVNKTCGMHVHLDMRNRSVSTVYNNLVKSQNLLYAMNPVSRLTGRQADGSTSGTVYSKKVDVSDFEQACIKYGSSRYLGINHSAFSKHKTLEVRIHTGSTNYDKIVNWISILVAIAEAQDTYDSINVKPETFGERYNISEDLIAYMKERIAKFKNESGEHITIDEAA